MSSNQSSPDPFSLREAIKKRKAQAAQRELEQRQIARLHGDPLPPTPAEAPVQRAGPPANRRVNPIIAPLPPRPTVQEMTRPVGRAGSLSPRQIQLLFGGLAAFAMLLLAGIGIVVITLSAPSPVTPNPTLSPLPVVSARDVLTYFENAGVPVTNVREYAAPNQTFAAIEEIQFEVYRGQDKGLFILLSYPSSQQRVPDLFKVNASPRFSTWIRTPVSNVLMLASPETASTLRDELSGRLMQYLVAPYRPYYPTSTPAVTPTTNP